VNDISAGPRDFDFLHGSWTVRHRRLATRGCGCGDWLEFSGSAETRPLLGGLCNIEEHKIEGADFCGAALRAFAPAKRQWSIYWVSGRAGVLEPPVLGGFAGPIGRFEGADVDSGRLVGVRFKWDRGDPNAPRWEQSFSYDDGLSWELNWTMDFRRTESASR
jgi:hypothetical protein